MSTPHLPLVNLGPAPDADPLAADGGGSSAFKLVEQAAEQLWLLVACLCAAAPGARLSEAIDARLAARLVTAGPEDLVLLMRTAATVAGSEGALGASLQRLVADSWLPNLGDLRHDDGLSALLHRARTDVVGRGGLLRLAALPELRTLVGQTAAWLGACAWQGRLADTILLTPDGPLRPWPLAWLDESGRHVRAERVACGGGIETWAPDARQGGWVAGDALREWAPLTWSAMEGGRTGAQVGARVAVDERTLLAVETTLAQHPGETGWLVGAVGSGRTSVFELLAQRLATRGDCVVVRAAGDVPGAGLEHLVDGILRALGRQSSADLGDSLSELGQGLELLARRGHKLVVLLDEADHTVATDPRVLLLTQRIGRPELSLVAAVSPAVHVAGLPGYRLLPSDLPALGEERAAELLISALGPLRQGLAKAGGERAERWVQAAVERVGSFPLGPSLLAEELRTGARGRGELPKGWEGLVRERAERAPPLVRRAATAIAGAGSALASSELAELLGAVADPGFRTVADLDRQLWGGGGLLRVTRGEQGERRWGLRHAAFEVLAKGSITPQAQLRVSPGLRRRLGHGEDRSIRLRRAVLRGDGASAVRVLVEAARTCALTVSAAHEEGWVALFDATHRRAPAAAVDLALLLAQRAAAEGADGLVEPALSWVLSHVHSAGPLAVPLAIGLLDHSRDGGFRVLAELPRAAASLALAAEGQVGPAARLVAEGHFDPAALALLAEVVARQGAPEQLARLGEALDGVEARASDGPDQRVARLILLAALGGFQAAHEARRMPEAERAVAVGRMVRAVGGRLDLDHILSVLEREAASPPQATATLARAHLRAELAAARGELAAMRTTAIGLLRELRTKAEAAPLAAPYEAAVRGLARAGLGSSAIGLLADTPPAAREPVLRALIVAALEAGDVPTTAAALGKLNGNREFELAEAVLAEHDIATGHPRDAIALATDWSPQRAADLLLGRSALAPQLVEARLLRELGRLRLDPDEVSLASHLLALVGQGELALRMMSADEDDPQRPALLALIAQTAREEGGARQALAALRLCIASAPHPAVGVQRAAAALRGRELADGDGGPLSRLPGYGQLHRGLPASLWREVEAAVRSVDDPLVLEEGLLAVGVGLVAAGEVQAGLACLDEQPDPVARAAAALQAYGLLGSDATPEVAALLVARLDPEGAAQLEVRQAASWAGAGRRELAQAALARAGVAGGSIARRGRALALAALGNFEQAVDALRGEEDPAERDQSLQALAAALGEQALVDDATDLALAIHNPIVRVDALLDLAERLAAAGQRRQAAGVVDRAVSLVPALVGEQVRHERWRRVPGVLCQVGRPGAAWALLDGDLKGESDVAVEVAAACALSGDRAALAWAVDLCAQQPLSALMCALVLGQVSPGGPDALRRAIEAIKP